MPLSGKLALDTISSKFIYPFHNITDHFYTLFFLGRKRTVMEAEANAEAIQVCKVDL